MANLVVDPTVERVSACPVHFIWDGRGAGRVFVRLGFLALLVAAALGLAHVNTVAIGVLAVGGSVYAVGQIVSLAVSARTRRRNSLRSDL